MRAAGGMPKFTFYFWTLCHTEEGISCWRVSLRATGLPRLSPFNMEKKGKEAVGSAQLGRDRVHPRKAAESTVRASVVRGQWGRFGKITVCAHKLILTAEVQRCVRSP